MAQVLISFILIIAGLVMLALAGDKLVDYAAATARRARLTPEVIGLTIVAMGTSLPEMFVSVLAVWDGSPDIAVANVVGSNIANIALILGFVSLFVAIPVSRATLKFDFPILIFASVAVVPLFWDGNISRLEAGGFVAAMIVYIWFSLYRARKEVDAGGVVPEGELDEEITVLAQRPLWRLLLYLVISLAVLGLGARLLVTGAIEIARLIGISERVIGLTIVAFGTSLPELVASISAALKRQHEMAVANVVGSNMFNLLLVLGAAGLLKPIRVSPEVLHLDIWVMLGVVVVLYPFLWTGKRLTRWEGAILFVVYIAYTVMLFLR